MIGAGVDDERRIGESVGVLAGLAVREREEDDVVPGEHLGRRRRQFEMSERPQVRLVLDERLPGVRMRGDGADVDVGMSCEDPKDLAARIAGCAGDGDRIRHGFHLREYEQGPRTATPAGSMTGPARRVAYSRRPRSRRRSRRRAGTALTRSVAKPEVAEGMRRR